MDLTSWCALRSGLLHISNFNVVPELAVVQPLNKILIEEVIRFCRQHNLPVEEDINVHRANGNDELKAHLLRWRDNRQRVEAVRYDGITDHVVGTGNIQNSQLLVRKGSFMVENKALKMLLQNSIDKPKSQAAIQVEALRQMRCSRASAGAAEPLSALPVCILTDLLGFSLVIQLEDDGFPVTVITQRTFRAADAIAWYMVLLTATPLNVMNMVQQFMEGPVTAESASFPDIQQSPATMTAPATSVPQQQTTRYYHTRSSAQDPKKKVAVRPPSTVLRTLSSSSLSQRTLANLTEANLKMHNAIMVLPVLYSVERWKLF